MINKLITKRKMIEIFKDQYFIIILINKKKNIYIDKRYYK